MNRRLRNHALLSALCAGILGSAWFAGPPSAGADRLSIVSAYLCLALLGAALLIGPIHALRRGRPLLNSHLRRDVGIWGGLAGLLHFFLANALAMNYAYLGRFVDDPPGPPSSAARDSLYTWGTIAGYVVAVLILVLLAISSDRALRLLGPTWWKRLQRSAYVVFALTVLHAFAFQVLEIRAAGWVAVVAVAAGVVVLTQGLGKRAARGR